MSSPTQESNEHKAEFRKITNEAANRKYRRHSPLSGSSDEEGSPKRDHMSRGTSKAFDHERRNNDKADDRSFSRRSSDRHSSRGNRYDEQSRYGKHADEDDRSHAKSSARSGRESRGGSNADYRDRDSDYGRSRDRYRDVDKYPRDKSDRNRYDGRHGGRYDDRDRHSKDRDHHQDEKRDYRSSRDHRGNRTTSNEYSTGHKSDPNSKLEIRDMKDLDGSKFIKEKSKNEALDKPVDRHDRATGRSEERSAFESDDFAAKRPKFSSGSDPRKDERQVSGFKKGEDFASELSPEQGPVSGADSGTCVDAAKIAAIRAAQLVNQNLTSTGFMTADQKKKLLWGKKKTTVTEESSHHWDTSLFSDRERQEKFNKLMGVKGEVKVDTKLPSSEDAEKQRELQLDLEKQYTAGLRRRDGRTVGLGL